MKHGTRNLELLHQLSGEAASSRHTCTALPKVLVFFPGRFVQRRCRLLQRHESLEPPPDQRVFVWIYLKKSRRYHLSSGKAASICHCPLQGHTCTATEGSAERSWCLSKAFPGTARQGRCGAVQVRVAGASFNPTPNYRTTKLPDHIRLACF
jgi:hypothetical protein